tara:strand:- start:427 stop:1311 length:885 start_codon:yes stop_codon:yes gene_type:complete
MKYFELEPEKNTFSEVVADLTHRCNMKCKNCYIPNRDVPDMDVDKLIECISKFPKKITMRLIGAEPTMRRDLPEIIERVKKTGHRAILLTNGLRLSNLQYAQSLKDAGLRHCYISLNGVDNDDWYEEIDELRCSTKKIMALENMHKVGLMIDVGCILVKGCNDDAPARMINLMNQKKISNCVIRFKNIGNIGRHMEQQNWTGEELIDNIAQQLDISSEYIRSWKEKVDGKTSEYDSFYFPIKQNQRPRRGRWIKIANWNNGDKPLLGSTRRGRITEDFQVAPFFEHVVMNEGGY